VIVLFNPFGPETCAELLRAIEQSLDRNQRNLRIGYFNPACANVFDAQSWLHFDSEAQSPAHHYSAKYWSTRC